MKAGYLLGRCANGYERDKGRVVHLYSGWESLCGKRPGPRSAGWSSDRDLAPSCPKCIAKKEDGCPSCGNPMIDDVGELCAECYQTQGEQ